MDCKKTTGATNVVMLIAKGEDFSSSGETQSYRKRADSGRELDISRCAKCGTALWSKYHAAPGDTVLLRAGTLDDPGVVTPDVHIFTRSKLPWLPLPADVPAFETFYRIDQVWPAESLERWRRLRR